MDSPAYAPSAPTQALAARLYAGLAMTADSSSRQPRSDTQSITWQSLSPDSRITQRSNDNDTDPASSGLTFDCRA